MRLIIMVLFFTLTAVPVHAQIVLDGTMGTPGPLQGPDFNILSEYGQQAGLNLFHSFSQFNVNTGESATFSGPSSVQNIISRVTGGDSSWIDGRLASSIDGASLYLLNPAGVMFGQNASLDLSASFHVSTGNYLRLGENERFYAEPLDGESLSTAAPTAFGFLDDDTASISLDGVQFSVHEGQTLSLIGGKIQIKGSEITAPSGEIHMQSLASAGEAPLFQDELPDESQISQHGEIRLSEGSALNTDGAPSGDIFIRCGKFMAQDSHINAINFADENGGLTDILADEISFINTPMYFTLANEDMEGENISGNGERIRFRASASLHLTDTYIDASVWGIGDGADFLLEAPEISLTNTSIACIAERAGDAGNITMNADSVSLLESKLLSESSGIGDAGIISVDAENVFLGNYSMISSYSGDGIGKSGDVHIYASGSVAISSGSTVYTSVGGPASHTANAGDIEIRATDISLTDGGLIASSTYIAGNGGNITLEAADKVLLSGTDSLGNASRIYSSTYSKDESAGNAGHIHISADRLRLEDSGSINASTEGPSDACSNEYQYSIELNVDKLEMESGSFISSASNFTENGGAAGPIRIAAEDSVSLENSSSIITSSKGQGDAADITLETPGLYLRDGSLISSSSNSQAKGGHAGTIELKVGTLGLDSGAVVSSISRSQAGGGHAGEIIIRAEDSVRLSGNSSLTTDAGATGGGQISVNTGNSISLKNAGITSSVGQGEGQGGDVAVDSEFVILNHGTISANADQGDGGAIFIRTENFLKSSDSKITASSRRGNEGTVRIEAPDMDISSGLTVLSDDLPDAERWMKTPCASRSGENASHFVIRERDGIPAGFDDWLPSPPSVSGKPGSHSWECFVRGNFAGIIRSLEGRDMTLSDAIILSHAYSALGHYQNALTALRSQLPLAEETEDPSERALFFSALGDLHLLLGDVKAGIKCMKKGLAEARTSGNPLVIASVLNNLGNIRAVSKNYSDAMKAYQESITLIGTSALTGQATTDFTPLSLGSKVGINMARTELARGKHQNALTAAEQAELLIENQPDTYHKAADMISLTLVLRNVLKNSDRKSHTEHLRNLMQVWLAQAADIGGKIQNDCILSHACAGLAQCYEDIGQYSDAIRLTRKAIFSAQQGYLPELSYRWQWQMGRLHRQQGDIEKAVECYRNAVRILNPIRMEFLRGFRCRKNTFDEQVRPVYLGLAELLLKQAEECQTPDGGQHSAHSSSLKQAKGTMELLKKAELQDFFRDECLTAREYKASATEHVPSRTAVIYPILLPDHLVLLLMLPDAMRQISVPVSSEHLSLAAKRFRRQLEKLDEAFSDEAARLYDWLIRPAESEFRSRNIDTLIIAPDAALRLIPFSALHDGDQFLIEKYALGTIPAMHLTDADQISREDRQILLGGLSEAKPEEMPLESVSAELQAIRTIMGGKILLDQDFTSEKLRKEVRDQDYDIVHLSTHAIFGSSPEETFLLTHDGKLSMNGLEQLVGLRKYQENQLELLTLSACETALGDERAAFGLAGVALKAGARSAIATLWSVSDKVAFLTVSEFYRQMATSHISKAEALQYAQKKLIGDSEYGHPGFWAPFLLIGNWL